MKEKYPICALDGCNKRVKRYSRKYCGFEHSIEDRKRQQDEKMAKAKPKKCKHCRKPLTKHLLNNNFALHEERMFCCIQCANKHIKRRRQNAIDTKNEKGEITHRQCEKCGKTLSINKFYFNKSSNTFNISCKRCRIERIKQRYHNQKKFYWMKLKWRNGKTYPPISNVGVFKKGRDFSIHLMLVKLLSEDTEKCVDILRERRGLIVKSKEIYCSLNHAISQFENNEKLILFKGKLQNFIQ